MASIIRQFTITVPANTPMNSLYTATIVFPAEDTETIVIEVPPGPSGLMGFYLAMAGTQLIPFESGEFIVWDDRFDTWALDDFPDNGNWQLVAYNLDKANTHDVVLRFHDNPLTTSTPPSTTVNIVQSPALQPVVAL